MKLFWPVGLASQKGRDAHRSCCSIEARPLNRAGPVPWHNDCPSRAQHLCGQGMGNLASAIRQAFAHCVYSINREERTPMRHVDEIGGSTARRRTSKESEWPRFDCRLHYRLESKLGPESPQMAGH